MVSLTKLLPHKREKKGITASEPPHDAPGEAGGTVLASVTTDDNGRTVGLEDPNNPALVDDPAIFASDIPVVAVPPPEGEVSKDLVDSKGKPYIDPRVYGGTSIDQTGPGLGEPLNVIVSALSSPDLLTRKGLQQYLRSLDLDMECFGLHSGNPQKAWLDPRGWVDENFLYREVYTPLDHLFGTCIESLRGGNHIRVWQQMGTGAWFFAASKEEDVSKHHMIIPDGYNIGRDWVVQQSQRNKNGVTSFMFKTYQTQVEYLTDLMPAGTAGINHNIATDGRTALLTIKVLSSQDKAALKAASAAAATSTSTSTSATTKKQKRTSLLAKVAPSSKKTARPVSQDVKVAPAVPVPAQAGPIAAAA